MNGRWLQERRLEFELYHEKRKFDFSFDDVLSTIEWCVCGEK